MKTISLLLAGFLWCTAAIAQHDQAHNAYEDKYGKEGKEQLQKWMENMGNVKIEPEYNFQTAMDMHIVSYKNGAKKDEMDLHYYFNTKANCLAMKGIGEKKEGGGMTFIYDFKPHAMIMLDEKSKTGFAMNMNALMSEEMQKQRGKGDAGKGSADADCRKTGKTKDMMGYSCDEYVCENKSEGTRSEMWVAKKLNFDISKTGSNSPFAAMFNSAKGIGGGMLMECVMYKHDQKEMEMRVTKVDEQANLKIVSANYKFQSMGGMR